MGMRFDQPCRPECGAEVRGTADLVPGTALVQREHNGSYTYAGETKVWWYGQVNELDQERFVLLKHGMDDVDQRCPNDGVVLDCAEGQKLVSRFAMDD